MYSGLDPLSPHRSFGSKFVGVRETSLCITFLSERKYELAALASTLSAKMSAPPVTKEEAIVLSKQARTFEMLKQVGHVHAQTRNGLRFRPPYRTRC